MLSRGRRHDREVRSNLGNPRTLAQTRSPVLNTSFFFRFCFGAISALRPMLTLLPVGHSQYGLHSHAPLDRKGTVLASSLGFNR